MKGMRKLLVNDKECKNCHFFEVKYGKDHKYIPNGSIPVYGSGGLMRKCNQVLYDGESVLIPRKGSLNNIIYGHHRLDNTMFGPLDTLFTQEYYASTDHQIFFLTQDKIYIYEVFSVYEIDPEIYYLTTRFNTETEYMEFLTTLIYVENTYIT